MEKCRDPDSELPSCPWLHLIFVDTGHTPGTWDTMNNDSGLYGFVFCYPCQIGQKGSQLQNHSIPFSLFRIEVALDVQSQLTCRVKFSPGHSVDPQVVLGAESSDKNTLKSTHTQLVTRAPFLFFFFFFFFWGGRVCRVGAFFFLLLFFTIGFPIHTHVRGGGLASFWNFGLAETYEGFPKKARGSFSGSW